MLWITSDNVLIRKINKFAPRVTVIDAAEEKNVFSIDPSANFWLKRIGKKANYCSVPVKMIRLKKANYMFLNNYNFWWKWVEQGQPMSST